MADVDYSVFVAYALIIATWSFCMAAVVGPWALRRRTDNERSKWHVSLRGLFVRTFRAEMEVERPKIVGDVETILAGELKVYDTQMQRLEQRIPSTEELVDSVKRSIPPAPNLDALEARILARIPSVESIVEQVVRHVKAEFPDPPDLSAVAGLPGAVQAAFSTLTAQLEERLKPIEDAMASIATMDATEWAKRMGRKGNDAKRAAEMEAKWGKLMAYADITDDPKDLEKIAVILPRLKRIGKHLGFSDNDVTELEDAAKELLATKKDLTDMQKELTGSSSGSGAIKVGVR